MPSYEQVLERIGAVPQGAEGRDRTIQWLTDRETVGAARDYLGHIELFLAGPELKPRSQTVRKAIEHHAWHRAEKAELEANRLLFPAFGHFDQIAAFIAAELLRQGADDDLTRAFAATEPIIELTIKRLELSEAALVGLAGELLLLDALVRHADAQYVGPLVSCWYGWRRSARDLTWDGTGVEIKTTMRPSSSHVVQGTHQVEPERGDDMMPGEDRLMLVSIGLQASVSSANAFTVPQLTQRIVERLIATDNHAAAKEFVNHVSGYGTESGFGYHHPAMADEPPFNTAFTPAFVRGYDMGDPAVQVLRSGDVVAHPHVDAQSLSFTINLPASISLDNPVDGLHRVVRAILEGRPK